MIKLTPESKVVIIYHNDCNDGTASAAVCKMYCREQGVSENNLSFYPVDHGNTPPLVTIDQIVMIVDFSFSKEIMAQLDGACKNLLLIDHHKTAQEALTCVFLKEGSEIVFDMAKSGCVLVWEYFYPSVRIPQFLLAVQDEDIFLWRESYSRAIVSYLNVSSRDIDMYVAYMAPMGLSGIIASGNVLLTAHNYKVQESLTKPLTMTEIGGYVVPWINITDDVKNDVGAELAKSHLFVALYKIENGAYKVSLRSQEDASYHGEVFDTTAVAKQYGGGGHRCASAFRLQTTIPTF